MTATESPAVQERRNPREGWIYPTLADRIINDVREGLSFDAICERQHCSGEVTEAAIRQATAHGFLTRDEAAFRAAKRAA